MGNSPFVTKRRVDLTDFVEFEHQKVKSWLDGAKASIDSVEKVINETDRIS